MLRQNVNVSEIRERCLIGNDASKAYLLTLKQKAKAQRIFNRAFDDGAWNAGRPVGPRQKTVNRLNVETAFIARNFVWKHG